MTLKTPSRARTLAARIAKVVAALGLLALAAALGAAALATRARTLQRGWQTLSAQQIAAGTRPSRDHLEVQGRALTRQSVRFETRQTRNGNIVSNSERVSFFVPVVPDGWSASQPVHVVVHTQPSGFNLVDANLEEAPAWRGAVADLEPRVREELQAMNLRVADGALVVDLAPGSTDTDDKNATFAMEAFYALAAGLAALVLIASALRAPWAETTLARRLHRDALGNGGGFLFMAVVGSPIPLVLLGNDPGVGNWLGFGVSGLIVLCCAYAGAMNLWRAPAQTPEAKQFGERLGMPFEQLAETLDRELGPTPLAKNELRVLPSFLCQSSPGGISLVPFDRVAWVYVKNGPALATIVIECVEYVTKGAAREGFVSPIEQVTTPPEAERLFAEITERAPWAIQGWDPELAASRADVLRRYEQRRGQYPRGRAG